MIEELFDQHLKKIEAVLFGDSLIQLSDNKEEKKKKLF